jgi:hypothetical protein
MATNRDLLKEAIADAKAVKETAIANAKAALEEAFTPYLKEKLASKINEMDEAEEMEEMMYDEAETMEEMKEKEDMMDEEVSLDELLAELEEESDMENENYMEEELYEAEEEEEEMSIEDMSEDDLKSFIEDVIKDMVSAGELEAGHEGMENEEGAEEEMDMETEEEIDEEINIDELLAEIEETKTEVSEADYDQYVTAAEAVKAALAVLGGTAGIALSVNDIRKAMIEKGKDFGTWLKGKIGTAKVEMDEQLQELQSELNEVNLLNAKLLYTNKIFRNKSLTESQKVKVLTAFDKATSKKEAQLVYETLLESLKVSTTKAPIKESLGSASKVLGGVTSKPIIENDAFARMRELAFGNKK